MRLASALLVVLGCVEPASAADSPPLTSLADVARADALRPVRIQATVTYCDPTGGILIVQERDLGLIVRIPLDLPIIAPGQMADIRGKLIDPTTLEASDVRSAGPGSSVVPLPVNSETFGTAATVLRRVAIRGVVRSVQLDENGAVVSLASGRRRIPVRIRHLPLTPVDWTRFVDSEVEAIGVCQVGAALTKNSSTTARLLVHRLADVTITKPAPVNPFDLPITAIAAVRAWSEHRVRVSGTARGAVADGVLTLQSGGQTIDIAVPSDLLATAGDRFDAVGFPTVRDGRPFLEATLVRGYAAARDADPANVLTHLPIIQSIRDLRRMSTEDAGRGYPVRLQVAVTFHEPANGVLFVHDGSEGIFVFAAGGQRLRPGAIVLVEGYSDPGEFAPSIRATRLTPVRSGRLPETRRYGYEDLVGGREDCQFVEVEAVVRGVRQVEEGGTLLLLRLGPETCPANFAGIDPDELRSLFGATVRVRAVCGSQFNARRQWTGLHFYIPSPDSLHVLRPAPAGLTEMESRSIESLAYFDPRRGPGEPVKLTGLIIARRESSLVLQDATGGIAVDLQTRQPGHIGDRVDVRGFLVRRGHGWALEDGVTGPAAGPPETARIRDVTPNDAASGLVMGTLIRLEGILVDQFPVGESDYVFLLRSIPSVAGVQLFFPAVLPRERVTPELSELAPGTRLRVTGACVRPAESVTVAAFRIALRDPSDVAVVARPPWWTPGKSLTVAGIVAGLTVLSMVWVVTLRQRVSWQTQQMRRRLEREAQLEAQYRDLFESASDAVFTLDANGTVTAMNLAGRRLTGLAVGGYFLGVVTPASAADARALVGCQAPTTKEIGLVGPAGLVLLEVSARPLIHGGSSTGVQAIARDLTERRRLEAELRQAQKMEAIGRLAGGIAHDFNNLLTVINGNAEVLRGKLPTEDDGLADEILRAGERAAALTRQLLAFSRKQVIAPRILCPNRSIDTVRKMLVRLVGERVEVVTDLDESVGRVKIDPAQLEQALLNLAVNARDAMPNGGRLTIRTRTRNDHARIEVVDTGVGMDERTRGRAFEPFFTTKPTGEGTGLGLATVKNIVEQAGGTISVQSEPRRGSTFAIELPSCTDSVAPAAPVEPTPPPANREVILLVEDEPAVQLLERRVLEMGRYEVLVASNGEEALQLIDQHAGPIDLLVTDVVMPGMTGRQLAEVVALRRPGLRALFLSGYTPDEVLRQGVRAEEAYFLQKPFTPSSLLAKVREVLSHVAAGNSSPGRRAELIESPEPACGTVASA